MNIWRTILTTAVQCPSPHNVQPWRIKILDSRRAELLIDSTRTLPKEDVTGSFIILTMGMFLEAIRIVGLQHGFKLDYKLLHQPEWYAPAILETFEPTLLPFARLQLTPVTNEIETVYPPELFFKRRTSRLSLAPDLVPDEKLANLKKLSLEWRQNFAWTIDKSQIERILELNTSAMFADMNTPAYHDEIVEWFRYSDAQSKAELDGLDYRCMNTPRATFWTAAKFPWIMRAPIINRIFAKLYRSQLGMIPTIGFLAGDFWQPADAIETGHFLLRFWLEAARNNLYMHPFGNLVTNHQAAAAVKAETGIADAWLVFKLGYSPEPPKSYRLPLEKVLVD